MTFRVALANIPFAETAERSVLLAEQAIADAASHGADLICFPEAYVPGYRAPNRQVAAPDAQFLERAWSAIAAAAATHHVAVILGTERVLDQGVVLSALVIDKDGTRLGFQDKVQIDPSEEATYRTGDSRQLFQCGQATFGIAICHEGWRYPETVRWAAKRGAQIVFHPHFHEAEPDSYRPTTFADPKNSFHEKAALCRAAENTCFFVMVNYAGEGAPTTSAVIRPDGTVMCYQPYGKSGVLVADLELDEATRLLATRCRY